ncbi:hypothetical protein ACHAXS_011797 [Conticribra weissflogii]
MVHFISRQNERCICPYLFSLFSFLQSMPGARFRLQMKFLLHRQYQSIGMHSSKHRKACFHRGTSHVNDQLW